MTAKVNFATATLVEATRWGDTTIWTIELRYQRFIHSELMTHRDLSRSASSSRAIPVRKQLAQVWSDPAMPNHWGKNQPGMQAKEQLTGWRLAAGKLLWKAAGRTMCAVVWLLDKLGAHKQWANRLLEPWQYITVLVTSTRWDNLFALRLHPDAQPEFYSLAAAIRQEMDNAIETGQVRQASHTSPWHMPYTTVKERQELPVRQLLKISAARCARVSYLNHDGSHSSKDADFALHDRLVESKPEHASPTEHQAIAGAAGQNYYNLTSWKSYRYLRDQGTDFNIWYNGWGQVSYEPFSS
jgi:hypothetical protein